MVAVAATIAGLACAYALVSGATVASVDMRRTVDGNQEPASDSELTESSAALRRGLPGRQTRLFGVIAVALVVSLFAVVFARLAYQPSAPVAGVPLASATDSPPEPSASATSSGAIQPTATTPTPTAGASSDGPPASTPTPTTPPITVTSAQLVVNNNNYNGLCNDTMEYSMTLTLTVAPQNTGGTVYVYWSDDSGELTFTWPPPWPKTDTLNGGPYVTPTDTSQTFAPGQTTQTQTYQLGVGAVYGNGALHWVEAQVANPNTIVSPKANFALTCQREVSSIVASASPTTWNAPCGSSQMFQFSYTFTISPGPPDTVFVTSQFSLGFNVWSAYPSEIRTGDGPTWITTFPTQNDLEANIPNGPQWTQISLCVDIFGHTVHDIAQTYGHEELLSRPPRRCT